MIAQWKLDLISNLDLEIAKLQVFFLFIVLSLLVSPLTDGLTKVNVSEIVTRLTTD